MRPILIYSLVFPPDGVSTAQLYGEIAADLAARGHEVSVVTTTPHYGVDQEAARRQPLTKAAGGLVYTSTLGSVRVRHVLHPGGRRRLWKRLIGWSLFHIVGLIEGIRIARLGCAVLVPSPLLSAGLIGAVIARWRQGSMIYNVQELYPDLAVRTGRVRNRLIKALLYRLERCVYARASAITAITPGMVRKIVAKEVAPSKVHFVPNFVDLDFLRPQPRLNAFGRQHDLPGRFVVSYAGNMGFSQELDLLVDAAVECAGDEGLTVAFIGDGPSLPSLQEHAARRGAHNVKFIPQQPYALVPDIYASSDLCVVSLRDAVEDDALPSKVLRIMACGRAVLAICDEKSDLASLVREAKCGFLVHDRSPEALTARVRQAMQNPELLRKMGSAGREFVSRRFARAVITGRYSDLVESLTDDPDHTSL